MSCRVLREVFSPCTIDMVGSHCWQDRLIPGGYWTVAVLPFVTISVCCWISRCSQEAKGFRFSGFRIMSVLFRLHWRMIANLHWGSFSAVGITISTSKSKATALSWKRVDCTFGAGNDFLPQEKCCYLRVLFTSREEWSRRLTNRLETCLHWCYWCISMLVR